METLESSRVCRLCGQQSGISINIFDENENHVRKINAMLPIMVHEMDLLPKHMCHRCSYKLEEFHKFYMDCLKTDAALKNQLSWMQKDRTREKTGVPMVHIENVNIKTEPLDYDVYELEPIVENIDYINSMASSVAFPAGGIHKGLTYAAFSRCRCCCDKKDQGRRSRKSATELCRHYEELPSVARSCGGVDSRKRTLEDARARLRPAKRKAFACAVLQDRTKNHLPHVNTTEDARIRLRIAAETKDVSPLNTRNRSHDRRLEETPESQAAPKSTIVRNLRPRKNLVNYTLSKKPSKNLLSMSDSSRMSNDIREETFAESKSNVADSKTGPASNFKLTRQIKIEQIDETDGRSLRPRKNVDYYESKRRKGLALTHREQRRSELAHRAKKQRKMENVEQKGSEDLNTSNDLKFKIKQETPNDLNDTVLGETTSAICVLPKNRRKTAKLSTKSKATSTTKADVTHCLKSSQPRVLTRSKIQLTKQRPIVANLVRNNLAKPKKTNRSSRANYSPKFLRSQDICLRNGKRKYVDWMMKGLRTERKLTSTAAKDAKKVPVLLKLPENIKYYCETCNVSFINMELFKLHACTMIDLFSCSPTITE